MSDEQIPEMLSSIPPISFVKTEEKPLKFWLQFN